MILLGMLIMTNGLRHLNPRAFALKTQAHSECCAAYARGAADPASSSHARSWARFGQDCDVSGR